MKERIDEQLGEIYDELKNEQIHEQLGEIYDELIKDTTISHHKDFNQILLWEWYKIYR